MGDLQGAAVLVVDDDPDNLEIIHYLVGQKGGVVRSAANARDALEVLLHWTPDIMLLDISMPEIDGYDLLATVRGIARLQSIPAVAVTAHAYEADKQKCFDAGFAGHMSKPYDPDELLKLVGELVKK